MSDRTKAEGGEEWIRSAIGRSTPDSITVAGRDVADDLMGRVSFTELAFLLVAGRVPDAGESRLFDAVLVSLTDHGLTPTVLAARLTYTGAPESIQGAIAAGLLGAGSVFLGPTEDTALFLRDAVLAAGLDAESDDTVIDAAAADAVAARLAAGARVPGLGHPVHKQGDPRVPRLYEIAADGGIHGPHMRLLQAVARAQIEQTGRRLPINGAGAAGAALVDLGLPAEMARGFAILARAAGLLGHLQEERERELGMQLYLEVEDRMIYDHPADGSDKSR